MLAFELGFRDGFSSWILELEFVLRFRVGFSRWIFELDSRVSIRVRISSWIFGLGMVSGLHIVLFRSSECIGVRSGEYMKKISLIIEKGYQLVTHTLGLHQGNQVRFL